MPLECPKCKSPVAREGQRFCYRCGHELNAYYDSLKIRVSELIPEEPAGEKTNTNEKPEPAPAPKLPSSTVVLDAHAFDTTIDTPAPAPQKALLKILLPTGDVFDRELTNAETQIGKGPRNDIVIADPAVSAAHALVRFDEGLYTIKDIGSRNGTFVNGERVAGQRQLNHGDVIGVGLSKLTFRLADYSETGSIDTDQIAAPPAAAPPLTEESLANAVVAAGLAPKADVDRLRQTDSGGRRLYRSLIEGQIATEESLRDVMSRTFQIPTVDLKNTQEEAAVVAQFPAKLALEHQVFAFAKEADALVIAVADPTDTQATERLTKEVNSPLSLRLATSSEIREQVDRHYGPKLIGLLPSGDKLEYPIDKKEIEIGKAAHNHIVLNDPTVSNTHAIVMAREDGYAIVDLGSRNGTFVNGERLGAQAQPLKHGDKVQLGKSVLSFRNPAETAANVTAVLSGPALEEVRRRGAGDPGVDQTDKEPQGQGAAAVADASVAAGQLSPEESDLAASETAEALEKKKKKKKKKKGKDERLKAAYIGGLSRIVAQVFAVVLAVLLALYVNSSMRSGQERDVQIGSRGKPRVKPPSPGAGITFEGGVFEASSVVQVPGTNGVLIVDDNKPTEVLWMQLNELGQQVGPVSAIPLGTTVDDPEGITSDGTYFYIVGSQSKPATGENALVRFAFDAESKTVQKAEALTNLRDFLVANVPELKEEGDKRGIDGGLNIEGIAWDLRRGRWLLGLRSPLSKEGHALVVAIKLRNPAGAFSGDNLQLAEPRAILLPLAGLGIRDIQYNPQSNTFFIISGAPEHHDKTEFTLWEWDGSVDQPASETALRREPDLDLRMKPEGVANVEIGTRKFILIVGDSSSYMRLDYAEAP